MTTTPPDDFIDKANRFLTAGGSVRSTDFASLVVPDLGSMLLSKVRISPERRQFLKLYLPQLLPVIAAKENMPMVLATVLGGLYATDCWRDCLASELQAYSLASALLTYVASYSPDFALDDVTWKGTRAVLNTWLKPEKPWTEVPRTRVVASHMFGSVWCDLFLPDNVDMPLTMLQVHDHHEEDAAPAYLASRLVLSERPPFLPGLCGFDQTVTDMALPSDLGAAVC